MGPDWVLGAKFRLDTTKSSHLLHTLLTLLSNQGWPKDAPRTEIFTFCYNFIIKTFLKMGPNGVFSAKFSLGAMKSTYILYIKWTLFVTQVGQKEG